MSNSKILILVSLIAILLLSLSFGLGYLVGKETSPAPIIIEKNAE